MIDKNREQIHRSSTLLTGHLQDLNGNNQKETVFKIKREIRTIISEMNKIAGFCDNNTQKIIIQLSEIGSKFTLFRSTKSIKQRQGLIDYWSSQANVITLDYNKEPFKLSGGFKINLGVFTAFLKGETERQ